MSMLRVNQRIGNYRVLRVIGEGGMGIVYEAEDTELQRRVAVKVMRDDITKLPGARERFLREARAMAALKSDHVVTIYQVGVEGDVPYFVMELLEGRPLNDYLTSGKRLTWKQLLRLAEEMAQGLADAHSKGLIHRDIKPANVFIELPRGRVKILDFGLARPTEKVTQQLTKSGAVMGTPHYMAPEQAGGKKTDARADLFSLGVILYQMATGDLPFQGESIFQVLMAIGMHTPPPVRQLCPDAPPGLSNLIDKLLEKERDNRPSDATEVLDSLDSIGDEDSGFAPPSVQRERSDTEISQRTPRSSPPRLPTKSGPSKGLLIGLFVATILVIGGIVLWMVVDKSKDQPGKDDRKEVVLKAEPKVDPPEPKPNAESKKEKEPDPITIPKPAPLPIPDPNPKPIIAPPETKKPVLVPPKNDPPIKPIPRPSQFEITHSRFPDDPRIKDDVTNSLGMKLVWIPPGNFEMGSPGLNAAEDETPCKRRRITRGFWMSAFEVTQGEFQKVMGYNPSRKRGAELPVTNVSFDDCLAFCDKMKLKSGIDYRLPTEAQWEYACRAGSRSIFSFGDDEKNLKEYGWFDDNSNDEPHPVGQKRGNAWGLYDMHGNVDEWCLDSFDESFYGRSAVDDPVNLDRTRTQRVRRGGSYSDDADECRSAYRYSAEPKRSFDNLGFRVIVVR